ncbi:type IV pilin N-terminal domain-containing protein [Methanofollis ethanolicus]|uniref:type IV pilin N-terminal domain-containing protein n=1 Tax=Methanofollis ethanolicus TaxID=488124 RepID=UPI0008362E0B|nr:type IV pilin N-terminal domain-containing protein [Methanofollis ethanolicus]
MTDRIQHEEAVSSVVGEMIMIVLVIILVALFATSAFSLLPGDRETSIDIAITGGSPGSDTISLWHKGGDWVEKKDLKVVIIRKNGDRKEYRPDIYDHKGNCTEAFDLGGSLKVNMPGTPLAAGDTVRLVTPKSVIWSTGEIGGI